MHIPRYWRAQNQRYSLTGEICKQCGARLFPPRDVCPECRELALDPFAFDLDEKIYSLFTHALEVRGEGLPQAVGPVNLPTGGVAELVLRPPNAKRVSLLQKVPMTSS